MWREGVISRPVAPTPLLIVTVWPRGEGIHRPKRPLQSPSLRKIHKPIVSVEGTHSEQPRLVRTTR